MNTVTRRLLADLGEGIEVWMVPVTELREQAVNAQVMAPRDFERLTENIRTRGALESLPYTYWPADESAPIEIVSGHHRVRAALAAGLAEIPVLVERNLMTRSEVAAKQIAHNQLTGSPDDNILRELLKQVTDVDDLLATGLPDDFLPTVEDDPTLLATPTADFDWRTVSLTFLPHQMTDFSAVLDALDGRQDLVAVAPVDCYEPFVKTAAAYGRVKDIRAVGTTVTTLTRLAAAEVDVLTAAENADETEWVAFADIFGTGRVPPDVAAVLRELVDRMTEAGDVGEHARWRALELVAADWLAGPG